MKREIINCVLDIAEETLKGRMNTEDKKLFEAYICLLTTDYSDMKKVQEFINEIMLIL